MFRFVFLKVIFNLICTTVSQVASLQKLEMENKEEAEKLEEIVNKGEELLKTIQKSLEAIASSQLQSQALESNCEFSWTLQDINYFFIFNVFFFSKIKCNHCSLMSFQIQDSSEWNTREKSNRVEIDTSADCCIPQVVPNEVLPWLRSCHENMTVQQVARVLLSLSCPVYIWACWNGTWGQQK